MMMTQQEKNLLDTAADILESNGYGSSAGMLRAMCNREVDRPTVAGYGHLEKIGERWGVPGIGRVNHEWLTEALGREPVDEEKVTSLVTIRPGIHL